MFERKLSNSLKTRDELKIYFDNLKSDYEGYIQMSDSRFKDEHLLYTKMKLPTWGKLHEGGINYILEMALFNGTRSILVRQHNEKFLVLECDIDSSDPVDSYYLATSEPYKMKIAKIWEEESSEFCKVDDEELKVLEAKYLMFTGFENFKGGKL